jgi:hypothetical protein
MFEYSIVDITWSMYVTPILIAIIIIIIIHYIYAENVVSSSHVTFMNSVLTSTQVVS